LERRLKLAYVAAVCTWGLLSYFQLLDWMRTNELFSRSVSGKPYINDFVNTYSASHLAARCLHHPINIYDPAIQDAVVRPLVAPVVPEHPFYFQYPPHYFLLTLPLALFSLNGAWLAWVVVMLAANVVALRFLTRDFPQPVAVAIIGLSLASFPWWQSVQLGQASLLIFTLLTVFFEALRRKKFVLAGIAVAFASVKLQYLPALGIIGLVTGGLPFLMGLVSPLLVMLGASIAVLGLQNVLRFPQALAIGETGRYFTGVNPFAMQNFRGELWLLTHGETAVNGILVSSVFVIAIVILGLMWKRYASTSGDALATDRQRFDTLASISVLLMLVSSLHTHTQDYVFTALPCIWICRRFRMTDLKATTVLEMRTKRLIFGYPLSGWIFLFLGPLFTLIFVQPFFAWALLFLACIILMRKEQSSGGSDH
jgi:Glycosyltransferase family 87